MRQVSLPDEVVRCVLRVYGRRGASWLRGLPDLVNNLMDEWSLVSFGEPFARARAGLVAPVRGRDGADLVLKVLPVAEWAAHEAEALAYWSGRRAVRLIASKREQGSILMERVNPGTSLVALCSSDDRAATRAAASVIAELRSVGTSAAVSLPNLTSWLASSSPRRLTRYLWCWKLRVGALCP